MWYDTVGASIAVIVLLIVAFAGGMWFMGVLCTGKEEKPIELTDRQKLKKVVYLLKKVIGPWTPEDDINCLDDVLIMIRKTLDEIGEEW